MHPRAPPPVRQRRRRSAISKPGARHSEQASAVGSLLQPRQYGVMVFPVVHRPLISNGVEYTLHHLTPFRVGLLGKGIDGRSLTVRVSYHSHVYSRADSEAATEHRFVDEGGKWREFCTERYALCMKLPSLCNDIICLNYPSWESTDNGGRNNLAVCEAQPMSGIKYLIFYELLPGHAEGGGRRVRREVGLRKALRRRSHRSAQQGPCVVANGSFYARAAAEIIKAPCGALIMAAEPAVRLPLTVVCWPSDCSLAGV